MQAHAEMAMTVSLSSLTEAASGGMDLLIARLRDFRRVGSTGPKSQSPESYSGLSDT
jgi:hypothetical protein